MKEPRMQVFFYRMLFVILFLSLSLFVVHFFINASKLWAVYNHIYVVSALIYTWFVAILLFRNDIKTQNDDIYPKYNGEKITVIVPCYNEHPVLLTKAMMSVYAADGNKEIIIVDDGSTNDIDKILSRLENKKGIKVHYLNVNQGKRQALYTGIKKLTQDTEFVVLIDSDTMLEKDSIVKIVEPLKLSNIGAASGDVKLLNEKRNLLTRMIGAYYWKSLNIQRKAQSSVGIVGCCSGCLSAYKKELISDIMEEFINQTFMGQKCTYSEDRHLTNLVLKRGYDVVFRPEAVCLTYSPHTIKGFLKQQIRWRRGYIRESCYTLTFALKKKPILFFQLLFWDLTMPFISFAFMLTGVFTIFLNPIIFLQVLLPSWIIFSLIRNMPLVLKAKEKIPGLLIFIGFYEFILYWQFIYALFTLKKRGWVTR